MVLHATYLLPRIVSYVVIFSAFEEIIRLFIFLIRLRNHILNAKIITKPTKSINPPSFLIVYETVIVSGSYHPILRLNKAWLLHVLQSPIH